MLAVESSASDMLRLLPMAYDASCGASSFHHSDSLAFNLSDCSMEFNPVHDEATIPANSMVKPESAATATSIPESSIAERVKLYQDLSSSWPCNKHRCKAHLDKPKQKKKKKKQQLQQRRRSMMSPTPSYKKNQKTTKVRFSPTLEVRTHSIVLGDHPFCEDGLALELGWDYEDSKDICGNGVEHNPPRWRRLIPNYPYPKRCLNSSSSHPRHLSAVERKRLLLEVGGCSETEIRLRQFQTRILLQVHQLQVEQQRQQPAARSMHNRSNSSNNNNSNRNNNKSDSTIPVSRLGSPSKPLYAAMA